MNRLHSLNNKLMYIALLAGLILSGCSQVQNLPFKTIAKESTKYDLTAEANLEDPSDFLILTGPEEINASKSDISRPQLEFSRELAERLRALDYRHSLAIVVFRRLGATSHSYIVDVRQVTRDREKVVMTAHFGEPRQDEVTMPGFSYPYHIIAVSKEGKWTQNIHFVLEVDGKEVKEHTYFIP